MNLSRYQKKYLKKNFNRYSLEKIIKETELSYENIYIYAKKNWPKDKFKKLIQKKEGYDDIKNTNKNLSSFIKNNWGIFIFLAILIFIIYFNSLNNDFLSDDIDAIKNNLNLGRIEYFFKPPFNFNPRGLVIYLINKIFYLSPIFYRLPNVLFHIGSSYLVFIIFSLFFSGLIPLVTATIFAVHPIMTESITWISGGPYSFGSFFFLLSLFYYLKFKENRKIKLYFFSIMSFTTSFLISEKFIVLPIIIFLYEILFGKVKKNLLYLLPFIILSFIFVLKLVGALGGRIESLQSSFYQESGYENPLVQIPIAITSYISLIFWPSKLTLYHSELSFTQIQFFIIILFTIFFFFSILFAFKKNKKLFFWLSFFIITLLPTLTPFKISWVVAERYVYLGSVGIFLLIAITIDKLYKITKNKFPPLVIFLLIIILFSIRTIVRNFDWRNQDTLWLATAKTSPSSHQNHNNLGDLYARHREFDKAVEEFKKSIELKPNYGDAYHNLANVYRQQQKDDLALENYQKAIELNPNLWQSYQNIGAIFFIQEKYDLALSAIQKAVEINPNESNLRSNLGIILLKLGENKKAEIEFEKALQINPQDELAKKWLESLNKK